MAHIYFTFDFGTDEEKAQLARHKLEMWKQAFRLDKKMLYKFERSEESDNAAEGAEAAEAGLKPGTTSAKKETTAAKETTANQKTGKAAKTGKSKAQAESDRPAAASDGNVRLYLRLAFSAHEKMTEERLLKKIPSEEPFSELSPKAVKDEDAEFGELEAKFDSLD
jgi:hypothetical protein